MAFLGLRKGPEAAIAATPVKAPAPKAPEAKSTGKPSLAEAIQGVKDAAKRAELAQAAAAQALIEKNKADAVQAQLQAAAETLVKNEETDVANAEKAQAAAAAQLADQQKALERAQANLKAAVDNTAEQRRQLKDAQAQLAAIRGGSTVQAPKETAKPVQQGPRR